MSIVQPTAPFTLSHHNTLGLTSSARMGATARTQLEVEQALAQARENQLELHVLGGGSNVVLHHHIPAFVLLMAIDGCQITGQTPDAVCVTAGAGVNWHYFVLWTLANSHPGLENLAGIPGTVGAAPVQNIGAYGIELQDFFHSLVALDVQTNTVRRFDRAACRFGYRDSMFKRNAGRYIILEVTLRLPRQWQPRVGYGGLDSLFNASAQHIMEKVLELRSQKLPDWRKQGNAGSFFHNPVVDQARARRLKDQFAHMPLFPAPNKRAKLSAGWLIEQCGLKGARIGGAAMSDKHALVLVNHGDATQSDVANLADLVRTRVQNRFGVELVQEPSWL